jgi:hypothetical protein
MAREGSGPGLRRTSADGAGPCGCRRSVVEDALAEEAWAQHDSDGRAKDDSDDQAAERDLEGECATMDRGTLEEAKRGREQEWQKGREQ